MHIKLLILIFAPMKKFITVLLTFNNGSSTISIESLDSLHELEIYTILEKLVPAFISVNYNDDSTQGGYSYEYKNGLHSVAILRNN